MFCRDCEVEDSCVELPDGDFFCLNCGGINTDVYDDLDDEWAERRLEERPFYEIYLRT